MVNGVKASEEQRQQAVSTQWNVTRNVAIAVGNGHTSDIGYNVSGNACGNRVQQRGTAWEGHRERNVAQQQRVAATRSGRSGSVV